MIFFRICFGGLNKKKYLRDDFRKTLELIDKEYDEVD
jgi:hypothetical protein